MASHIDAAVAAFARDLPDGAEVLDVGCGLRPYEAYFAQGRYVGIDVESSGREAEGKLADAFFDGVHVPYEDGRFGAALCTQVLEHAAEPEALLRDVHRVLAPGGRLLVTVPFVWGEHEVPYDFRRYSTFGLRRALDEAGFEVVRLERLLPGVEAVRTLVAAEMVHDGPADGAGARVARRASGYLWAIQLRLWRRLYRFGRIYLDNLAVAEKR